MIGKLHKLQGIIEKNQISSSTAVQLLGSGYLGGLLVPGRLVHTGVPQLLVCVQLFTCLEDTPEGIEYEDAQLGGGGMGLRQQLSERR